MNKYQVHMNNGEVINITTDDFNKIMGLMRKPETYTLVRYEENGNLLLKYQIDVLNIRMIRGTVEEDGKSEKVQR